jgi:hypothetical protein
MIVLKLLQHFIFEKLPGIKSARSALPTCDFLGLAVDMQDREVISSESEAI